MFSPPWSDYSVLLKQVTARSKKKTQKRALFQRSAHCSKTQILQEEGWLFPSLEEFHERSVFSSSMPEKPTSIVKAKAFDAYKDCWSSPETLPWFSVSKTGWEEVQACFRMLLKCLKTCVFSQTRSSVLRCAQIVWVVRSTKRPR